MTPLWVKFSGCGLALTGVACQAPSRLRFTDEYRVGLVSWLKLLLPEVKHIRIDFQHRLLGDVDEPFEREVIISERPGMEHIFVRLCQGPPPGWLELVGPLLSQVDEDGFVDLRSLWADGGPLAQPGSTDGDSEPDELTWGWDEAGKLFEPERRAMASAPDGGMPTESSGEAELFCSHLDQALLDLQELFEVPESPPLLGPLLGFDGGSGPWPPEALGAGETMVTVMGGPDDVLRLG